MYRRNMGKQKSKKYCGTGLALVLLCGMTACADHSSDEKQIVWDETTVQEIYIAPEDTGAVQKDMEVPGNRESSNEDTQALNGDETSGRKAFAVILENIYTNHIFPDGKDYGYDDFSDISSNTFAVYDIDGDGKEELLINYTTTSMAGMVAAIYDYDSESDTVTEEFLEFPALKFYDNGIIEAEMSHNQGLAGDFWPYRLYQYSRDTDTYIQVGIVDAWDKSLSETDFEGNPFPAEIDSDGDGIVYYIMTDGTYELNTPLDEEEYNQWRDSYVGESAPVEVPFKNLTRDNIKEISGS